jgi:hypothetical protein
MSLVDLKQQQARQPTLAAPQKNTELHTSGRFTRCEIVSSNQTWFSVFSGYGLATTDSGL